MSEGQFEEAVEVALDDEPPKDGEESEVFKDDLQGFPEVSGNHTVGHGSQVIIDDDTADGNSFEFLFK